MSEPQKVAVDKLTMLKNLSDDKEIKEIAKIMIEYIKDTEKPEMGFSGKDKS